MNDSEIIDSWQSNAQPWIKAIENDEIESRKLVTNNAIIETIEAIAPKTALDIGCGEGWLARELLNRGVEVFGIDAIPELVEKAKSKGGGRFEICTYENLSNYAFGGQFDCLICNFSLIGKESTENVIRTAYSLLKPGKCLVIQTLHPVAACGELPYQDGWRQGSWAGFSSDFTKPAPWYFRTIESWEKLFQANNFILDSIKEPVNPKTAKPASIIFQLKAA